jgi:hypothetical protein
LAGQRFLPPVLVLPDLLESLLESPLQPGHHVTAQDKCQRRREVARDPGP